MNITTFKNNKYTSFDSYISDSIETNDSIFVNDMGFDSRTALMSEEAFEDFKSLEAETRFCVATGLSSKQYKRIIKSKVAQAKKAEEVKKEIVAKSTGVVVEIVAEVKREVESVEGVSTYVDLKNVESLKNLIAKHEAKASEFKNKDGRRNANKYMVEHHLKLADSYREDLKKQSNKIEEEIVYVK